MLQFRRFGIQLRFALVQVSLAVAQGVAQLRRLQLQLLFHLLGAAACRSTHRGRRRRRHADRARRARARDRRPHAAH